MTAIILAGGQSRRMGSDKAFIKIEGLPLIKRQLNLLKGIFKKIIIVSNSPKKYRFKNIKAVTDIIKNRGPLSGLHAGLKASGSFYNFVLACDMPFLNERLVRYMLKNKNDYDVFVPKVENKFHPLFGVYSKNCIPVIENMLKKDDLRVLGIFPKVKSGFISKKKIQRFDKGMLSLANINTPEDLKKIR